MWCLALYLRRVGDMHRENNNGGDGEPDRMLMRFLVPRRADGGGTVADEGTESGEF
jgi:hypothetical protein